MADIDLYEQLRGLKLYLKEGAIISIGDDIKIQVFEISGKTCRISIDADPKKYPVHRLFASFEDIRKRGGIQ